MKDQLQAIKKQKKKEKERKLGAFRKENDARKQFTNSEDPMNNYVFDSDSDNDSTEQVGLGWTRSPLESETADMDPLLEKNIFSSLKTTLSFKRLNTSPNGEPERRTRSKSRQ